MHMGQPRPLGVSAIASRQLAAVWASGRSWALKPAGCVQLLARVCGCRAGRRTASPGCLVQGQRPPVRLTWHPLAVRREFQLGARRASQPGNSVSLHSETAANSPWVMDSQARPKRRPLPATASSTASRLSASSSVSVMVPGVTTRTTLRSTGPLLAPTSPDLLGNRHRFAQLDQLGQVALQRCTGTPAITGLASALAALGQGQVQQRGGLAGVGATAAKDP